MAIIKARMQNKRGNEADFDPDKMLPGEWAVSVDTKYVRMCFAAGVCIRMATYEAFEADMEEIREIVLEARTIQEAVARIQTEINDTAVVVEDYSILSKSYAVGGTGTRENENSDNAKYYYEQTKQISQGINGIVPMGTVTFANLPTEDIVNNAMYNVSDAFTSDERFNDGGGIYYGPGNNVVWTEEGKWDVTASSSVTGVKGENEKTYRQGNVTITADNIGLGHVKKTYGTTDISKIADGTVTGAISDLAETTLINTSYTDIEKSGKYYLGINCTDKPSDNACFVLALEHPTLGGSYLGLIAIDVKTGKIYTDTYQADTGWLGWNECAVKSDLDAKNFLKGKAGANTKISFDWIKEEDDVWYLVGYIGEIQVFKLRQDTNTKSMRTKMYSMTRDASVVSQGDVYLYRQGDFFHVNAFLAFAIDSISDWSRVKVGTISNWAGLQIGYACVLNSLGFNVPSLALQIDSDGSVYVNTHGLVSDLNGKWFYGRSTIYTSLDPV